MTEKLHVLAVLEDSSFKDAGQVKVLLKEYFNLKPSLDAVRKHLERCFDQELVTRKKIGRSYHYRISVKGRERLRRIRAKREKASEESRGKFAESRESESPLGEQGKLDLALSLFNRALLVATSIELCDVVPMRAIPTIQHETVPSISLLDLARKRREEGEYVFYLLEQERKEKERYKKGYLEEKLKREELEKEHGRIKLDWQRGCLERFKLGRKFGKLEAEREQIILRRKLVSSLLQDRLSRKQKDEEAVHAILLRRCINWRWWDLLPPSARVGH